MASRISSSKNRTEAIFSNEAWGQVPLKSPLLHAQQVGLTTALQLLRQRVDRTSKALPPVIDLAPEERTP